MGNDVCSELDAECVILAETSFVKRVENSKGKVASKDIPKSSECDELKVLEDVELI